MTRMLNPIDEPVDLDHEDDCPEGSDDRVEWVCDEGHWLATDPTPGVGDRCPIVWHDADYDGRCVGVLSRPECICGPEWR